MCAGGTRFNVGIGLYIFLVVYYTSFMLTYYLQNVYRLCLALWGLSRWQIALPGAGPCNLCSCFKFGLFSGREGIFFDGEPQSVCGNLLRAALTTISSSMYNEEILLP